MDIFVEKFQPEKYQDWKECRDLAPHPEDPPDVKERFERMAKDPVRKAILF